MIVVSNEFEALVQDYHQLEQLYELQRAYVMRKRINFSIVLLKYEENEIISYENYYQMIEEQLRNSDFAYKHKDGLYIILLLSISRIVEVKSFLKRLQDVLGQLPIPLIASIAEIANAKYELSTVLQISCEGLSTYFSTEEPLIIYDFLGKESELIKVSILENDDVAMSIFKKMMLNIDIPDIELEIQLFKDGLEFINSDWYKSGHKHIILLNDILPRKNGLEVLHYLRSLPNEQKYLIQFLSTRVSEDSLLNAMENGADGYFVRPFNLKVLETQIKNYLRRLN